MNIRFPKLPKWLAVIAILTNVLIIAGPDINTAIPGSARYVTLLTTLLLALTHSLGVEKGSDNVVSDSALRGLLAFILAPVLLATSFTMVACGASEVQRVVRQSDSVVQTARAIDPVRQLLAEGLISQAEAETLRTSITEFTDSFATFDTQLTELVRGNPRANLAAVVPLFVAAITHLNDIGAIHLAQAAASVRLNRLLSAVRIGVGIVAAFFAAKMVQAAEFLNNPRSAMAERAVLAIYGVRYDARKLAEARQVLKDGRPEARERAVCSYFGVAYDPVGLKLIQSIAAES